MSFPPAISTSVQPPDAFSDEENAPPLILVIEDDEALRGLLVNTLQEDGCRTMEAGSAAEAETQIGNDLPQAVLLDLHLPDLSQEPLLHNILKLAPNVPVIIITGFGNIRNAVRMLKLGAHDYLPKGESFLQEVQGAVRQTLGKSLGQEEDDLTERIKKTETFCSTVTETIGALVVVLDRNARITQFNRACQDLTGYTDEEVAGRKLWDFLIPDSEREAVREVGRRLQSGERLVRFENHWLTKDSDQRLISWSNSVVTKDDGEVDCIIATGIDITDRKNLEQELLLAADQERERLGRDLHDGLCQYLTGIAMMVESLGTSLSRLNLPNYRTETRKIAGYAREALEHTRLLAHGLAPLQSKTGDMAGSFAELAMYIEKVFQVKCRCFLPDRAGLGDAATNLQLFRITQEAIHNAVRHGMPDNIEISARREEDGALAFTITDDGNGFPMRPGEKGTGIRNMERRAALIGGELKISSTPGEGTTVTCLIPHTP